MTAWRSRSATILNNRASCGFIGWNAWGSVRLELDGGVAPGELANARAQCGSFGLTRQQPDG
jgi:hypothetical protein